MNTFVGSNVIVNFWGVLVSAVLFFAIYFGGCTVGGLELVSATSSLLVLFKSCDCVVCSNVVITVSVMLAASAT